MKLFRFDAEVGRSMTHFDSTNIDMTHLFSGNAHVICAYIAPEGGIGYHQAAANQLFCVVKGSGWVRSESADRRPITEGQAAYWEASEWHQSGSETGMTVVIIESESDLSARLIPLSNE